MLKRFTVHLAAGLALVLAGLSVAQVSALQATGDGATSAQPQQTITPKTDAASNSATPADPGLDAAANALRQQARQKAADARQQTKTKADDSKKKFDDAQARFKQRSEAARNDVTGKLGAAKLRVCQNHEKGIDSLMERIGKRGDNHMQLIDTVSERVQQFYGDQKLSVDGYDGLLSAVTDTRKVAQSAVTATDSAQNAFDCTTSSPQDAATNFKDMAQARNDAVKAYRDAVKQLVDTVKLAAKAQMPAQPTSANPADSSATGTTTVTEKKL